MNPAIYFPETFGYDHMVYGRRCRVIDMSFTELIAHLLSNGDIPIFENSEFFDDIKMSETKSMEFRTIQFLDNARYAIVRHEVVRPYDAVDK